MKLEVVAGPLRPGRVCAATMSRETLISFRSFKLVHADFVHPRFRNTRNYFSSITHSIS